MKVIGLGILGVASLAAAAGLALWARSTGDVDTTAAGDAWGATVSAIKVAGKDKAGGLQRCQPDGSSCEPVIGGTEIPTGSLLRTDQRTRVHLQMSDGTLLALDRATELTLSEQAGRVAGIRRGVVVADVMHLDDGPSARFELPEGEVEVIGTKFTVTVTEERSSVEVVRGAVRLSDDDGESVVVRAGEEGIVDEGARPAVMPASVLGDSLVWSERGDTPEGEDEVMVRGLGELRARKPGAKGELDRAVRLTKHDVKVRISGQIARTQIDETFTNDTDDVLEGIYRFPLPPDAQIERLALEVDGKLEEGAFVARERAAKIWRGVLHAAAPKSPKPRDEIIWVPGPWKDPALLEWQRGGRFELKIYPIPANGSRRVVLAYTQRVPRAGGARKYTYPLSYDRNGSTRIDSFRVDVQVRGHDQEFGVRSRGYDFESQGAGDAEHMTMRASSFVPSGDITLSYALPQDEREVTAWAYETSSMPADDDEADDEEAGLVERALDDDDDDAYVAIALRPKLPRWSEGKFRDQVIVVDASRSMVGERFERASALAERVVREMDRRDRFTVMACDAKCVLMGQGFSAPGGAAGRKVKDFLAGIEPDGGSDLVEAVRQARKLAGQDTDARELRIVYIGDGTPSVGPVRPPRIMQEVSRVLPPGSGSVTAVAVGADADSHALAAMARGGGGVVIPYVPGATTSAVAMRVLGASYGIVLQNPVVKLPPGLEAVYPKMVDNIPAGGETIVVARMDESVGKGDIELRGRVGGEEYEQTYPIEITSTTSRGNAFVPRLYAATKIADLEANQGESAKKELVELSKRFAVASRFTSLLVLESAAMFKAFGIDRNTSRAPLWTGEEDSKSAGADGLTRYADADENEAMGSMALGADEAKKSRRAPAPNPASASGGFGLPMDDKTSEYAPPPPAKPSGGAERPGATIAEEPPARRRGMVPMRRVWDRKSLITSDTSPLVDKAQKDITEMEREVSDHPNSRTRLEKLLGLYAVTGQIDRASDLAKRWAKRDALDPGALVARAETAARQGDRARAMRILGGLADVRPDDTEVQEWLARMHEAAGDDYLACSHRIALAGLHSGEADVLVDAVRCARRTQRDRLASTLRSDITEDRLRSRVDRLLDKEPKDGTLRGDVRIKATWDADVDLDVALIGRKGERYSWLGDPKGRVRVRDATATRREELAVFAAPRGDYVVEVTRADLGGDDAPVRGSLEIRAAGKRKTIPFVLSGPRTDAARLRIYYTSRLVRVRGW